jgi:hypothetical protein
MFSSLPSSEPVSCANCGVCKLFNALDLIFIRDSPLDRLHVFFCWIVEIGKIVQTPKFTINQTRKSTSVADGPMLITETIQAMGVDIKFPLISGPAANP